MESDKKMKDTRAFAWLRKHTEKYRGAIAVLTVLEIVISLFGVCYALVMKQMVDRAVADNRRGFLQGILLFAVLMIGQMVLRMITRQLSESVRSSLENTYKRNLFDALFHRTYASVSRIHSEEWMNRLTSDTAVCAGGMTDILPGVTGMVIRLVGALALICYLEPQLALIIVPGGVVFLIITVVLRKPLKRFHKEVQSRDGKVRVYLQERISSMLVVRTFGVEDAAVAGAEEAMQAHKQARMRKAWVSNLCNSGFSLAINGMYLLGIGYCGVGILRGAVSYGTLTAIIQLIGQLQAPLSGLGGYVPRYYAMTASAERLMEAETFPDDRAVPVRPKEAVRQLYAMAFSALVFDHVTFGYAEEMVLKDMSFILEKGDYVAVTGTSGCGKSTMLKLLMGIYEPEKGAVQAVMKDGTAYPVSELRRLFAYVPQGNYLMGGKLRDVVTFGQRAETARLQQALTLACAEFVYELPDGENTMLGERGAGLSEGQMQRIAIARALYADCPVLILDEATSALDTQTEQRLLENLKKLTDKTVLIVTHRPQALSICNKKIRLDQEGNADE